MNQLSVQPKILIWDLETAGVNAFKADLSDIVCFGYKWLGEPKAHCLTIDQFPGWFSKTKGLNDKGLLKAALKIMAEADLTVAHYGEKFDKRMFQGRCLLQGLTPPPPVKMRDTCFIAWKSFNFSSNRLKHLAQMLGVDTQKYDKKVPSEWPGWWLAVMAGDTEGLHKMREYCKADVQCLEQVYLKLRSYDTAHIRVFSNRSNCGVCGGRVQYRGYEFTKERKYRRFQCTQCGHWGRDTKAVKG